MEIPGKKSYNFNMFGGNGKILLSIIIPTYNCESYVRECLNSVLKDIPDGVELIVVDDGSSDNTKAILNEFESKDSDKLKIIYATHKGSSGARNTGLDNATGEFITFLDCDDCIKKGFLEAGLKLVSSGAYGADLYIFGIERTYLSGEKQLWSVPDRFFPTVSDFADEYIRTRQLLIYSNCNKFYKRSIIEESAIRFAEAMEFGEDRLFNYMFLPSCSGGVVTSSLTMLSYLQRSEVSMSTKYVPDFFKNIISLHKEKINCFCSLSMGTTPDEKIDFLAYDLSREVERAVDRFEVHPEEKAENLPYINRLVFGNTPDLDKPLDFILVLGSSNCEYRVNKALEISKSHPGVRFIVSGGNQHKSGFGTEAEFMANYLKMHGVPVTDYILENRALNTYQNLTFSSNILESIGKERPEGSPPFRVGIITGGFHIPRTRLAMENVKGFSNAETVYIPAYGPNTTPDNWFLNPVGRSVVFSEIYKLACMKKNQDYKKGISIFSAS